MLPLSLVPSFPAPSWTELERLLQELRGIARGFQVDIVDGLFVPHRSWPFTEAAQDPKKALASLAPYAADYELEVDCMVNEPIAYLDAIVAAGAKRVVIHIGSTNDISSLIAHAETHGYQLGVAATADVPLFELEALIPHVPFVQLMGIAAVGQQGQPFDERTLARARTLRERYPDLEIAVDGAVNSDTIPLLFAAGVNRFAPGSAITKADDAGAAYRALLKLITA